MSLFACDCTEVTEVWSQFCSLLNYWGGGGVSALHVLNP